MNLASLDPGKVATARRQLQGNFNGTTLLAVFLFQDLPEMQAAIDIIADGTVFLRSSFVSIRIER